jgi:dimethylhistidine N-methyltransferase
MLNDVLRALGSERRELSPKYLYDEAGSALFERICGLDEYYLTRTEETIHAENVREIAQLIGSNARIVEFGSGSGRKTMRVLASCLAPSAYVPVDISRSQLMSLALDVSRAMPDMEVLPVYADFFSDFDLPAPEAGMGRTVALYHGSTIGNLHPREAERFLARVGELCGYDAGLLVGVDLVKDRDIIERAYNDAAGVTAEFNLNLLRRINRECGADFDTARFRHEAFYDEAKGRIEMRLVSTREQVVTIPVCGVPARFAFPEGAFVTTEYSYKYLPAAFDAMAARSGWQTERFWTDELRMFGVWMLRRD